MVDNCTFLQFQPACLTSPLRLRHRNFLLDYRTSSKLEKCGSKIRRFRIEPTRERDRVAQKSKELPNYENIVLNRIKPANEIRFIRQIKT